MAAKQPPHASSFDRPERGPSCSVISYAPADRDIMWRIAAALKDQGMMSFNADMLSKGESHPKVFVGQYVAKARCGLLILSDDFVSSSKCQEELKAMSDNGLFIIPLKVAKHDRLPMKIQKFLERNPIPPLPFAVFEQDFEENIRTIRGDLLGHGVRPVSKTAQRRKSAVSVGGFNEIPDQRALLPGATTGSSGGDGGGGGGVVMQRIPNRSTTKAGFSQPVQAQQAAAAPESESDDEEDHFVRLPRMSVMVTPQGKITVEDKTLRRNGSLAASHSTQAMVHTHNGRKAEKWTKSYQIVKELGKGAFGLVHKVKHKLTKEMYAKKGISLANLGGQRLLNLYLSLREIELMKKLDHPNIIKVYEVYRQENSIDIIMELCTGGELGEMLESLPGKPAPAPFPSSLPRFSCDDARQIAQDMINALNYIHLNGIIHRDLKVENFIYHGPAKGEGTLKMIDFGLSRPIEATENMTANVGSMIYKAPEVGTVTPYTENSDLWSIGIIMQMLVTGLVPWEGNSGAEVHASVQKETADQANFKDLLCWFHEAMGVSHECSDFICQLLIVDPKKRTTASKIRDHPYLKGKTVGASIKQEQEEARQRGGVFDGKKGHSMAERVRTFKQQDHLHRTAMLALSFGMDGSKLEEIGRRFKMADTNGDGLISKSEFSAMMKLEGVHSPAEINDYFKAVNQDGTGQIKYSEFVAALVSESQLNSADQLEAAFHRLDVDGSGGLDERDFAVLLSKTYGDAAVKQVMQADSNHDGVIDLSEFKAAMVKLGSR